MNDDDSARNQTWRDKVPPPKSSESQTRIWWETWLHFGPLSGLFCMLLTALSLTTSLGILIGSNGQSVKAWSVPPSTYLAICTAVANMCVRYAITQGVIITWWRRALMGSTISGLQSNWRIGTTLRGALSAGPQMGLLGLACIASTVVVIDGPLLQRASTVIDSTSSSTVQLEVSIAPEIPHGFTGTWFTADEANLPGKRNFDAFNETVPSPRGPISNSILSAASNKASTVASSWRKFHHIEGVIQGCPGQCNATIRAPAIFPTSCTTQRYPVTFPYEYNITGVENNEFGPPLETDVLIISASLNANDEGYERINLLTGFAVFQDEFHGEIHLQACELQSGIGEYHVRISNNKIDSSYVNAPVQLALANNTRVNETWTDDWDGAAGHPSTLGGLVKIFESTWQAWLSCPQGVGADGEGLAIGALQQAEAGFEENDILHGTCQSYTNPHWTAVYYLNLLAMYMGATATKMGPDYLTENMDEGLSLLSTSVGNIKRDLYVYHTNHWFFLGAVAMEVVCLALIAPTYWGWWRLGRHVSFSPLELAKAFKSPIFAHSNSNSTGRDLAAEGAEHHIRYGVITSDKSTEQTELAFGEAAVASRPSQGLRFDK